MRFRYAFKTAVHGLSANKSRSFLTILGIVIGIASIMLIMALGESAKNLILNQIQGMGSKTIVVLPGREPKGPSDFASLFLDSLKERDLSALGSSSNVPYAEHVMPIAFGTSRLSFSGETYQATVLGGGNTETENVMAKIFDINTDAGRFFSIDEIRSRASVAVIGSKVKDELFGNKPALGEKVKIGSRNFLVIGTLPTKGQVSFFNFDEMVLVPYTTAGQYILGRKYFDRIVVSATAEDKIPETVTDIERTLRRNHSITDPEKDDFYVETQADIASRLDIITSTLTAFLSAVASISLFVGGIGIMNIMLVSVTERTREIGLRKALGAQNRDILLQFLLEAVLLTLAGGLIGILLGGSLAYGLSSILSAKLGAIWQFTFPWMGAVLGLTASILIGLSFGIYPARHASKKDPIEALRYE